MNKKIKDIISARKGKTVEINEVELVFDRIDLEKNYELEKAGINVADMEEDLATRPIEYTTLLVFTLFSDSTKQMFDNDVRNLRKFLGINDIEVLMEAIAEMIGDAYPEKK